MIVPDAIEKKGKFLCIDELQCVDSEDSRKRISEYCEKGGVEGWLTVYRYTPCGSKLQEWAYENIVASFHAEDSLLTAAALFVCSPRGSENRYLAEERILALKEQFAAAWQALLYREAELILWFATPARNPHVN